MVAPDTLIAVEILIVDPAARHYHVCGFIPVDLVGLEDHLAVLQTGAAAHFVNRALVFLVDGLGVPVPDRGSHGASQAVQGARNRGRGKRYLGGWGYLGSQNMCPQHGSRKNERKTRRNSV